MQRIQNVKLKEKVKKLSDHNRDLTQQVIMLSEQLTLDQQVVFKDAKAPLLDQLKSKDELIDQLKEKENDFLQTINALRAILKTPALYKEFIKTLTRKTKQNTANGDKITCFYGNAALVV